MNTASRRDKQRHRVVIVGGGAGGLELATRLGDRLGRRIDVTLIDRELFRFSEIWAAAGHPNGVFCLSPQDLERLTAAPVADVVQEQRA